MTNNLNKSGVVFNAQEFAGWVEGKGANLPENFCGVTQDTRSLKPGMLYAALQGERFDGHDFVQAALDAGAAAALVEQDWASRQTAGKWPLICVRDTKRALLAAARGWRQRSAARIIGITGSSGKTTTKEIAAAFCSAGGEVCCTKGNLNNNIGLPLSVLAMPPECDFGIFELGTNHPGEIALLAEMLQPDAGVITSVGSAHIENFGSLEMIAQEKGALLEHLGEPGFAVLSMEMEYFQRLEAGCIRPVVTVSLVNSAADYFAEVRDEACGQLRVTERDTGLRVELQSGLPGRFNAYNVLLAYAAARRSGVRADAMGAALDGLKIPGMRWQRITLSNGVQVINDAYNANPDSMSAVLKVFSKIRCAGRKVVVLGDMLELGDFSESFHRDIGTEVAAVDPDILLLVGALASRFIADGAVNAGFSGSKVYCFDDAHSAGLKLAGLLQSDDLLLLKASRGVHLEGVLDAL